MEPAAIFVARVIIPQDIMILIQTLPAKFESAFDAFAQNVSQ
jgi:hypothetical protein